MFAVQLGTDKAKALSATEFWEAMVAVKDSNVEFDDKNKSMKECFKNVLKLPKAPDGNENVNKRVLPSNYRSMQLTLYDLVYQLKLCPGDSIATMRRKNRKSYFEAVFAQMVQPILRDSENDIAAAVMRLCCVTEILYNAMRSFYQPLCGVQSDSSLLTRFFFYLPKYFVQDYKFADNRMENFAVEEAVYLEGCPQYKPQDVFCISEHVATHLIEEDKFLCLHRKDDIWLCKGEDEVYRVVAFDDEVRADVESYVYTREIPSIVKKLRCIYEEHVAKGEDLTAHYTTWLRLLDCLTHKSQQLLHCVYNTVGDYQQEALFKALDVSSVDDADDSTYDQMLEKVECLSSEEQQFCLKFLQLLSSSTTDLTFTTTLTLHSLKCVYEVAKKLRFEAGDDAVGDVQAIINSERPRKRHCSSASSSPISVVAEDESADESADVPSVTRKVVEDVKNEVMQSIAHLIKETMSQVLADSLKELRTDLCTVKDDVEALRGLVESTPLGLFEKIHAKVQTLANLGLQQQQESALQSAVNVVKSISNAKRAR